MILSVLGLKFIRKGSTGWPRTREFNQVLRDNTIREKTLQEVDNKSVIWEKSFDNFHTLPHTKWKSCHMIIPSFIFYALIWDER
jgi:hypothetical protein